MVTLSSGVCGGEGVALANRAPPTHALHNPLIPACALGRADTHRKEGDVARPLCDTTRTAARFGPTRPAFSSPVDPWVRALGIKVARAQIIPRLAPDTRLCKLARS
eukprot:scaffold13471_cov66-Phaeocystis_antarctica.AAC.3